jgi:nucleotidyltransferase/DNA polymerase involved in DNA repair
MPPLSSPKTAPSNPAIAGLKSGIACVHVPRFAVEVERQRRQDLAARLILIGATTVLDCSLGAETSGVRPGMRMSEALGLCHVAEALPPDPPYYQRRFEEMLDLLADYSPEVEAGDPSTGSGQGFGTAYLSLAGLPVDPQPFGEELASAMRRRLGLAASVGTAGGKFAARVLARTTRPGLAKLVPPGQEAAFLAPLPVDHLPASDSMRWRLRVLGIETMGEVARLPLGAFQQQFGPEGKRCWELAQGIDAEPLVPRLKEETIVRRLQLPAPAVTLDAVLAGLERLLRSAYACPERSEPLGERSRRGDSGRGGRWVRKVVLRGYPEGGSDGAWELPVPFREALAGAGDAWFAVRCAVERRPPERALEELEVELVGLSGESGRQATMFDGKARLRRQAEEAVRQLRTKQDGAREGGILVGKVVAVEPWSRIPERRMALVDIDR